MKPLELPKTLYVRIEDDGENTYPIADVAPDNLIEDDGPTVIGVYTLVTKDSYAKKTEVVKVK